MARIYNLTEVNPSEDWLEKLPGPYSNYPGRFLQSLASFTEPDRESVPAEHKRLLRYPTMELKEILELPVDRLAAAKSHLYLWVPNALLQEGLKVMEAWGFTYKCNLVWYKIRKDGGPDGRASDSISATSPNFVLFGVRRSMRTLRPGVRKLISLSTRKREHSRKPGTRDYDLIEGCSPGPYLELFARFCHPGWTNWGNEDVEVN